MTFMWMPIQDIERKRHTSIVDPIRTPTMAGGLFAIDRDFFYKLGTYDPEFKIWGSENLELSFKIWMCGGTLETVPCSTVGHVFRATAPHSSATFPRYADINKHRLVEVWLDEYAYYVPGFKAKQRTLNIGDLTERRALRRRLQCHSFAWFLMTVMPERILPADIFAHGVVSTNDKWFMNNGGRTIYQTGHHNDIAEYCLDYSIPEDKVSAYPCHGLSGNQHWKYSKVSTNDKWFMNNGGRTIYQTGHHNDIAEYCLDYSIPEDKVSAYPCHGLSGNQHWKYSKELQQLQHHLSGQCLTAERKLSPAVRPSARKSSTETHLRLSACSPGNVWQGWQWDTSLQSGPSWRTDLATGVAVT